MYRQIGKLLSVSKEAVNEYHVFTIAGQSNALTRTGNSPGDESFPNGTLQWGRVAPNDNILIPAIYQLEQNGIGVNDGRGWICRFANLYKEANPNVTLVFIPGASGGTSFIDNEWTPTGVKYIYAQTRTNQCMSENPNFKFKGFLWHQGESDAGNLNYQSQLLTCISDFRTNTIGATVSTPFILGGLLKTRIDAVANTQEIQDIIVNIPNIVPYTGYASSFEPTILTGHDVSHFNKASSVILGDRYYAAYLQSFNNT